MERMDDFIFLGSKITADGDCSLEIKRFLLLGRKVMTNLDNILISRDIILSIRSINSWEIDGEIVETVADFILGGCKITADGDCSHEIKRHLLLGKNVMTNLDSILKSTDITLLIKVHLVKVIVFSVVMYGYES